MHIGLTDVLCCPRCGPHSGLVLLAERRIRYRVMEGWLGCPECEERFPVRDGFADLVARSAGAAPETSEPAPARPPPRSNPDAAGEEESLRLAALLGVHTGPALVLLAGSTARLAPALATVVEGIEVVALSATLRAGPEEEGVSRLAAGPGLPFLSASIRAIALGEDVADAWLAEAVRILEPGCRLFLPDASPEIEAGLEPAGLRLLARQARALLAGKC